MAVTVPDLRPSGILIGDQSTEVAKDLVVERFEDVKVSSEIAQTAALNAINTLTNLFADATMPDTGISYDFQDVALDSDIESKRPDAPSDDALTPDLVTRPSKPVLDSVAIGDITIPSYGIIEPGDSFTYDEAAYQSDLFDALKTALQSFVEDGGTGLGATVEELLWERARARTATQNERVYDEANNYFASRGHAIPPGALAGRLAEAVAEETRANIQINAEISIEQARLAQAQTEATLQLSTQLEGISKQHANQIADRAYQYAKDAVLVIVQVYKTKVEAYVSRLQATELESKVIQIQAETKLAYNKSLLEMYSVEIEAYKVDVTTELSIVENVAKVYLAKIQGYEADVKVAEALLDAQIKEYQGRIEQANNETNLNIEEAKMTLTAYLSALGLQEEGQKAVGNIAAQLAASAMSAVNASASMSYGMSWGRNDGVQHSVGVGRQATLSEQHQFIQST